MTTFSGSANFYGICLRNSDFVTYERFANIFDFLRFPNVLWYLPNPLHPRRFHLHIGIKPLRHCLIYQDGSLFLQQFYPSFFDADEFVNLSRLAVEEVGDLGLFFKMGKIGSFSKQSLLEIFS